MTFVMFIFQRIRSVSGFFKFEESRSYFKISDDGVVTTR